VATQSPILGEANILRYLARQFLPQLYSDHNPLQITTIDDWLNSVANLASPKDWKTFIENLNTHLGKHNWLSGNALSIADIHCSVALQKYGSQFPKNVSKWMAQCKKELPGFDQVEKLCK
jgi:glutathione S-transferase